MVHGDRVMVSRETSVYGDGQTVLNGRIVLMPDFVTNQYLPDMGNDSYKNPEADNSDICPFCGETWTICLKGTCAEDTAYVLANPDMCPVCQEYHNSDISCQMAQLRMSDFEYRKWDKYL